jgi:antitoxin component HigA of HigAB toxin-antitoxin module
MAKEPLTHGPRSFGELPPDYSGLLGIFQIQQIKDEIEYRHAVEMAKRLAGFEPLMNQEQLVYQKLLLREIGYYQRWREPAPEKLPLSERLDALLELKGWKAKDLAEFLGLDPSMGAKILKGDRNLTWEHIKALAAAFHLSTDYFVD